MKKFIYAIICAAMCLGGTSCASIVTRSIYPVDFGSDPQGARLVVENRDGQVVFEGRTPATVHLEASAGYMRPENYRVTYRQPGQEPVVTYLTARLDGWYFGNLLFGGVIGMLIVDPLTGAMYKIPPYAQTVSIDGVPPEFPDTPANSPARSTHEGWIPLEP